MDALNAMVSSYDIMSQNNEVVQNLSEQITQIKSLIYTTSDLTDIEARIATLETAISNSAAIFANNQSLLDLIQRNYEEVTNIYKNYTSVKMSYNIDLLTNGQGIFLDKSSAGSVKIVNSAQLFNLGTKPIVSIANDFTTNPTSYSYVDKLVEKTNYIKITDGAPSAPYIVDRDVILYINDGDFAWEKGQTYRIAFKYGLDLANTNGNFNFVVYTDANDKLNTGFPYSAEAAYVTYLDFEAKGNSPIIEIICIDPATYQFSIDIY
jgi:hypothetical protein